MRFWRLSHPDFARSFDGGYGLYNDGRWNVVGQLVTYGATSPAVCVLEKLVHVNGFDLMPAQSLVLYDAPDDLSVLDLSDELLGTPWVEDQSWCRARATEWYTARSHVLLKVPSAVVPVRDAWDRNFIVNHTHPDVAKITIADVRPFDFDERLPQYRRPPSTPSPPA